MKFHTGSFLLGYAAGAGSVLLGRRLKPVLLEAATAIYQVVDAVLARAAMSREDLEDIFAEAKARARGRRASANGSAQANGSAHHDA